jgi:hypothetical protein
VLRVLQKEHASEEEIAAALREATEQLAALPDTDEAAWRRLMWFLMLLIYHRRAPSEHQPLSDIVMGAARERQREEEIVNMSNTIAEELIREGEARGVARAKQEDVLRVLQARFSQVPETLRQRVHTLTEVAQLDDLLVRAATADRWEEVTLE